mmetsp:Transcript_96412/g.118163  ORF Transcript_96412/g.118163 Transcript_96412/m.118163 type:complete len:213 (+) Transcript_96412:71-709(+)
MRKSAAEVVRTERFSYLAWGWHARFQKPPSPASTAKCNLAHLVSHFPGSLSEAVLLGCHPTLAELIPATQSLSSLGAVANPGGFYLHELQRVLPSGTWKNGLPVLRDSLAATGAPGMPACPTHVRLAHPHSTLVGPCVLVLGPARHRRCQCRHPRGEKSTETPLASWLQFARAPQHPSDLPLALLLELHHPVPLLELHRLEHWLELPPSLAR